MTITNQIFKDAKKAIESQNITPSTMLISRDIWNLMVNDIFYLYSAVLKYGWNVRSKNNGDGTHTVRVFPSDRRVFLESIILRPRG